MRGPDEQTQHTFTYLSPEQRVPADHPLRAIRALTDEALRSMSAQLEKLLFDDGSAIDPSGAVAARIDAAVRCSTPVKRRPVLRTKATPSLTQVSC